MIDDQYIKTIDARLESITNTLSHVMTSLSKIDKDVTHVCGVWRLRESERIQGLTRPMRVKYTHKQCLVTSQLDGSAAARIARNPTVVDTVKCILCGDRPVEEFFWEDGTPVGS